MMELMLIVKNVMILVYRVLELLIIAQYLAKNNVEVVHLLLIIV